MIVSGNKKKGVVCYSLLDGHHIHELVLDYLVLVKIGDFWSFWICQTANLADEVVLASLKDLYWVANLDLNPLVGRWKHL